MFLLKSCKLVLFSLISAILKLCITDSAIPAIPPTVDAPPLIVPVFIHPSIIFPVPTIHTCIGDFDFSRFNVDDVYAEDPSGISFARRRAGHTPDSISYCYWSSLLKYRSWRSECMVLLYIAAIPNQVFENRG